jgi:hypothetical protein
VADVVLLVDKHCSTWPYPSELVQAHCNVWLGFPLDTISIEVIVEEYLSVGGIGGSTLPVGSYDIGLCLAVNLLPMSQCYWYCGSCAPHHCSSGVD